jgi:hypothetical protein
VKGAVQQSSALKTQPAFCLFEEARHQRLSECPRFRAEKACEYEGCNLDFSNYYLPLSSKIQHGVTYSDAKKQGAVLGYGQFLTALLTFLP